MHIACLSQFKIKKHAKTGRWRGTAG